MRYLDKANRVMDVSRYPSVVGLLILGILCSTLLIYLLDGIPGKWVAMVLMSIIVSTFVVITSEYKHMLLFILIFGIPVNLNIRLITGDGSGLISGIFLTTTDICVIVFALLWAMKVRMDDGAEGSILHLSQEITRPAVLYVGVCVLSVLVSIDKKWSVFGVVYHLKLFLTYFVVANALRSKKELRFVLWTVALSVVVQGLVYIYQSYSKVDFDIMGNALIASNSDGLNRPRGFLGHANTAGTFFAASLILVTGLYFLERKVLVKMWIVVVFGVGVCALTLTYSRGAWLAFMVAMVVFIGMGIKEGWIRKGILIGMVCVLFLFVFVFWDSVMARMVYNDAADSRIRAAELSWRIIKDNFVLGMGLNTYISGYYKYYLEEFRVSMHVAHNHFLMVWAETGVLGLVSFIWFLIAVLAEAKKVVKSKRRDGSILAVATGVAVIGICVSMMTQPANYGSVAVLTWVLAGYMACIGRVYGDGIK